MKQPRARCSYSRKDSTAVLSTKDRLTTAFVKLLSDGSMVIDIHRNGKIVHKEIKA